MLQSERERERVVREDYLGCTCRCSSWSHLLSVAAVAPPAATAALPPLLLHCVLILRLTLETPSDRNSPGRRTSCFAQS